MQPVPARLFKGYIAIQLKTSFSLSFCAINSFWLTEKCYWFIEDLGKSNNVRSAVDYKQSLLYGEVPRARQKKLETKKLMLARHAKLWVHAPHSQSFRACAYIKIVFLLFYSRNGLRRKGGTARSQVQLIHTLLPRGPQVNQSKRKLMTLLIVYWKRLVPFKAVSKSRCHHFLLFYVQS